MHTLKCLTDIIGLGVIRRICLTPHYLGWVSFFTFCYQ